MENLITQAENLHYAICRLAIYENTERVSRLRRRSHIRCQRRLAASRKQ